MIPLRLSMASFLFLAGAVLLLDRVALALIRPRKKTSTRNLETLPFPVREHSFSSLGQPLKGWFVEPDEDRGGTVAVLVHGWGSSHGRMTMVAEPLLEAGYPVFLFDVRHHGMAPEAPFVTVRHYRDDILAAASEVKRAFPDRPVVLIGHSMGGSAAVLASVAKKKKKKKMVTIAAPADLWEVWARSLRNKRLPGRFTIRVLRPFWRYRAGLPFSALDPEKSVKDLQIPFLVLHGDRDQSVPLHHADLLAGGAGVEPFILEGEDHNELLGKGRLHQRVFAFLEEIDRTFSTQKA
jgi:pimeloyl-ACP methyl ester carboxylesterase